ncbi:MAG: GNAT family N-acetyltransferase [Vulcanimicrobiaceae bacterium]
MNEVLRWVFESQRAHKVYLETIASNVPARRLYDNLGFVLEGTWRDGFRGRDGAYHDLCAYGMLAREYALRKAKA